MVREAHDPTKVREEWQRLHRVFHRTLIAACGSSWLMRFHDLLFDQTIRYRSVAAAYELQRQDLRSDAADEHARIVAAVIARDADAAAAAIEKHYMTTASVIIEAPGLVAGYIGLMGTRPYQTPRSRLRCYSVCAPPISWPMMRSTDNRRNRGWTHARAIAADHRGRLLPAAQTGWSIASCSRRRPCRACA